MKNWYVYFSLLLPLFSIAQDDYLPFPTENVEWTVLHEQISSYDPRFLHNYHYVPDGDTTINGDRFTRLYVSDGKAFDRTMATYAGAYRSEGSQVFFVAKDSVQAAILYDFAISPGWLLSAVDRDTTYYFQLENIDSLTLRDGVIRKRYNFYLKSKFEEEPGHYHHSWIEGMGSTIGFFPDPRIFYMKLLPVDPIFAHWLLCYQEEGVLLYTDSSYYKGVCYREGPISSVAKENQYESFKIYPNPVRNYLIIEKEENIVENGQTIRLFDQLGRLVLQQTYNREGQQQLDISNLPKGVFVLEIMDKHKLVRYRQKVVKA